MPISPDDLRQCWFLAGPTAVGKTATSLELAQLLDAEILSLDSMAIYRGMDIGTAKPNLEEQTRVQHHLIDLVEPSQEFSTADYLEQAQTAVQKIISQGKTPLFAGGTGLYLRSLLRGVFEGPAADWDLRKSLEQEEQATPGVLWNQLKEVDHDAAARLHPKDLRRIIRALEVWKLTGRPLSEQQQEHLLPVELRPRNVFWLHPPRPWLAERINKRVELMFEQGLVKEVETLLNQTPPLSQTAKQGLGYKEVIEHLQGEATLAETIDKIQTKTRQFAKRQHTWFRNLEECREVLLDGTESPRQIAEKILTMTQQS